MGKDRIEFLGHIFVVKQYDLFVGEPINNQNGYFICSICFLDVYFASEDKKYDKFKYGEDKLIYPVYFDYSVRMYFTVNNTCDEQIIKNIIE